MNIVHTIHKRKAKWIGRIILRSNCLLKRVFEGEIEGMIEVTERRGSKCKQLLDNLKKMRGYWKLKEEVPDCTLVEKSIWKSLRACRRTDYGVLRFMAPKHRI